MAGKYQAYPEYKDLGTDWMGMVPGNWDSIAIGRLFTRVKRTDHVDKELLSVYRDHGVVLKSSRDDNNNKPSDDLAPYQLVQPNDLVLNKMKTWQGSIAISEYEGIVSPAYFVYKPNAELFAKARPKYIHYLLRNPLYIAQYLSRSKGIRVNQWDLDPDEFKCIELLLPSKYEQSTIINFLDHETAKIDSLIDKQQQLIKLLKEKRQSVISHAVTKGLNPDAPMKDSGVAWLGEVPEHWVFAPLRRFLVEHKQGYYTTADYVDDGVKLLRITDLRDLGDIDISDCPQVPNNDSSLMNYELIDGDVVFARTGGAGSFGVVKDLKERVVFASYLIRFRFQAKFYEHDYLKYMLLADSFQKAVKQNIHGGVNQNIHAEDIKNTYLTQPSLGEQKEIIKHLEDKVLKMNLLIAKAQQATELLSERRTALISAAVTGKIDVRNWQPAQTKIPLEASA